MPTEMTRDTQRHFLVQSRITAHQLSEASNLLYTLESMGKPAPIQSYTLTIRSMFQTKGPGSELQKAQAWDLFAHMRYAAHPVPSEELYATMIRAIADTYDPEAERALDLFTEMTTDNNITPSTQSYNAIILACARSRKYKREAFRLAREMVNGYRDAFGEVGVMFRPDRDTFLGLLEAAKRLGDLGRVRWILSEMIRMGKVFLREGGGGGEVPPLINNLVMSHVFHAYAAYRPSFRRGAVPMQRKEEKSEVGENKVDTPAEEEGKEKAVVEASGPDGFHLPQTQQEVVREASALWDRLIEDLQSGTSKGIFQRVKLCTPLVNTYLTVHFAKSKPAQAFKLFEEIYSSLGLEKDAHSYLIALGAYTHNKSATKEEFRDVLVYARRIWDEWDELEKRGVDVSVGGGRVERRPLDARVVEKVWVSMFRILVQ